MNSESSIFLCNTAKPDNFSLSRHACMTPMLTAVGGKLWKSYKSLLFAQPA